MKQQCCSGGCSNAKVSLSELPVGNNPGVTVESKSGSFTLNDMEIELIDLPGVHSLSGVSSEEAVVFEELFQKGIDLIVNAVDSTILQRSLYLNPACRAAYPNASCIQYER